MHKNKKLLDERVRPPTSTERSGILIYNFIISFKIGLSYISLDHYYVSDKNWIKMWKKQRGKGGNGLHNVDDKNSSGWD